MRSSDLVTLLAGSAAAQSTVTLLNLFQQESATLTLKGSGATATTYQKACQSSVQVQSPVSSSNNSSPVTSAIVSTASSFRSASSAFSSALASTSADGGEVDFTAITGFPTPLPSGDARLRRDDGNEDSACEPYILIQGPSTWEYHMTDPTPGYLTMDSNCHWKGEITSADLTCTVTASGTQPGQQVGTTTSVMHPSDISSSGALQNLAVITEAASASGSGTPSASATAKNSTLSTPPTNNSATPTTTHSTGLAPQGPLPTGAMAFVGGAAGLFVAALAL